MEFHEECEEYEERYKIVSDFVETSQAQKNQSTKTANNGKSHVKRTDQIKRSRTDQIRDRGLGFLENP